MNYAVGYLQDIVDGYPGGTSDEIGPLAGDGAEVRVWIDGAWYTITVRACDPQPVDLALPALEV